MLRWIRDFFLDKQTFASAVGDLAAAAALVAASPLGHELLDAAVGAAGAAWGPLGAAAAAYIGGAVSGRLTRR